MSDDYLKGAVLYHSDTFFVIKNQNSIVLNSKKNKNGSEFDGSS